jgi:tellurite resistance protein TerC
MSESYLKIWNISTLAQLGEKVEAQLSWWIGFHVFVFAMLALDLGVINRGQKEVSVKSSLIWTAVWIGIAMLFNLGVHHYMGEVHAYEFLTCFILEKSLSVDNIFVMTIIFTYFKVEPRYQHRVLFWGILGALVMRIVFILVGVSIIEKFHFVLYFFGAFLVYTGIKMFFSQDKEMDPEKDFIYKMSKRYFKMTPHFVGKNFFAKVGNVWHMTPLFLVLMIIESTDLIFALDSIPATLSVTKNPFVAYTSNIFAILGLRSLYFAFVGVVKLFRYLNYALSVVLIFIGLKMLLEHYFIISTGLSLGIVVGVITISVVASILIPEKIEN